MGVRPQSRWPQEYVSPPWSRPLPTPRRERRQPSLIKELVQTAVITLLALVLVRTLVANYKVDGLSMAPTLHHGQYLLVNRVVYASLDGGLVARALPASGAREGRRYYLFRTPHRGDIVVFWPPASSARPFIKRIVALPGETVEIRAGQVIVDGVSLEEPYTRARPNYDSPAVQVPPDHYFVLGDNRNNSSDSHLFGMLPADHIVGQAWLSYWPVELWGVLPSPTYAGWPRR